MHPFTYTKAKTNKDAIGAIDSNTNAKFIGGGTNLVDLMKMYIETPQQFIDITSLDLKKIETLPNGNMRIGALGSQQRFSI